MRETKRSNYTRQCRVLIVAIAALIAPDWATIGVGACQALECCHKG
jgi:hypothetical protein